MNRTFNAAYMSDWLDALRAGDRRQPERAGLLHHRPRQLRAEPVAGAGAVQHHHQWRRRFLGRRDAWRRSRARAGSTCASSGWRAAPIRSRVEWLDGDTWRVRDSAAARREPDRSRGLRLRRQPDRHREPGDHQHRHRPAAGRLSAHHGAELQPERRRRHRVRRVEEHRHAAARYRRRAVHRRDHVHGPGRA